MIDYFSGIWKDGKRRFEIRVDSADDTRARITAIDSGLDPLLGTATDPPPSSGQAITVTFPDNDAWGALSNQGELTGRLSSRDDVRITWKRNDTPLATEWTKEP